MLNFVQDGDYVNLFENGNQVLRMHNSSRAILWKYDESDDKLWLSVAERSYEDEDYNEISFGGVALSNKSEFETNISTYFPGYASGGPGGETPGIDDVLAEGQALTDDRTIDVAGKILTISGEHGALFIINPQSYYSTVQAHDESSNAVMWVQANDEGDVYFQINANGGQQVEIIGDGVSGFIDYIGVKHTFSGAVIVPTSDPGVEGALWNNAGTPAISAGA